MDTKETHYGNASFTQDQLAGLWKKYAERTKQDSGGFSGSVLANCEPTLLEDHKTVHLIFRTETNQTEFSRMEEEILIYLKSNLKNNFIEFDTEVNREKAKKVLYSNRDIFIHFTEQFPKLKDWETKLGLDLN